MFGIRVKMGPTSTTNNLHRSSEWTCLFGMHVRTATIVIGIWHLLLNIMVLGLLAIIVRNPEMIAKLEDGGGIDDNYNFDAPALPTPLSKIDPPYAYRDHSLNYHNIDMGGLVCVCMIGITLLMIYGAVKGKPSHLLPYFCVQLFDFAITTLTAAGYLCYLRSVPRLIHDSHRLPWREELLKLSPQALSITVLLAFISVVLLKAYIIGIIWRCYKFLAMRQHNLRSMLPYIIPDSSMRQERDYSTLLPDYDEAIAQSMKQQPPPSYQVAMSATTENNEATPNIAQPATSTIYPTLSPHRVATVVSPVVENVTPPPYNASTIVAADATVAEAPSSTAAAVVGGSPNRNIN